MIYEKLLEMKGRIVNECILPNEKINKEKSDIYYSKQTTKLHHTKKIFLLFNFFDSKCKNSQEK